MNCTPETSSPDEITSLTIFIELFEMSKDTYKSFNPTTSLDLGNAWISTILFGLVDDKKLIVDIFTSPFS